MTSTTGKRAEERREERRRELFPDSDGRIYDTKKGGFAQVPRVVPLVAALVNEIGGKENAGSLYQVLWAHTWGQGLVEVRSNKDLLYQAGYTGRAARADRTWNERVNILTKLRLIETVARGIEKHGFVLLLDPYLAILRLKKHSLPGVEPVPTNWLTMFDSLASNYNVDLDEPRNRLESEEKGEQ